MRILLTGATGFIGRHLLQRLAQQHEVFGIVRRAPAQIRENEAMRYIEQDLTQPLETARLPARVDAIIHQAAVLEPPNAPDNAVFLVNVAATWRLLAYAAQAGVRIFVHASTGGVYGCRDRAFVEDDDFNPMDLYSLTKCQAELALRHTPTPFPKVILRYFFPYGTGTPNPIARYVHAAVTGAPAPIAANRKPRLNPIHIDDAVEATVAALALTHDEVLNIAGQEVTTFAAIAETAARQAGRAPAFQIISDAEIIPYYRADLVASTARMQRVLAFTPQVNLLTGIAGMVTALKEMSENPLQDGCELSN